ncbi:MAG TPA: chemotaxis protein CheW [Clostridiales bacterium]|nr:chemotaxis protein CheW [Clostridiales bacterium]
MEKAYMEEPYVADETLIENGVMDASAEMENMYLLFRVEDAIYGIEIKYVLQIIAMQPINKMPQMPPDMKGYISLRGNVIPIISMRLHFDIMEEEYTERTCIIVLTVGEKEIGIIVDAIQETITIEPEDIAPSPRTNDAADSYVQGIAKKLTDGNTAILLDVPGLFINNGF